MLGLKVFSFLTLFFFFYILVPANVFAQNWYYPMDNIEARQTVKGFGQFINDEFYKGREKLFPYNRFYGYHAGVDLEAFDSEQGDSSLVPIFAIGNGTITYIGSLEGYGGVILESLDQENLPAGRQDKTALYGHVKIQNLHYKVGDHIEARTLLTYLGNKFSSETSGERKHLHFGIYKGTDLYFRGHEASLEALHSKWIAPIAFLKQNGARNLPRAPTPKHSIPATSPVEKPKTLLYIIFERLESFFHI